MTIEVDLFAALKSLVGNRMSPNAFPQPLDKPTWPAIRYTITTTPIVDIGGDGDDSTSEVRAQLDLVAERFDTVRTLRLSVMALMRSFTPPATLEQDLLTFDAETKTHRVILQYLFHGSSS